MPISTYALIAALIFGALNVVQCSQKNGLRERIGEERQKCATEFAEYRAGREQAFRELETEAAKEAARLTAELNTTRHELELRLQRTTQARAEVERQLATALRRANQEDTSWCASFVPSYLLED